MSQPTDIATLLQAARLAADKHRDQHRKGASAPPYINHPIEFADFLVCVGGVTDLVTLVAALLHDTIEDTKTKPEEVETRFGAEIRALVVEVTDNKSLPQTERKQAQVDHAPYLSRRAKELKIADKIANVLEITNDPPADWSLERKREYFEWAERVVEGCRGVNQGLEDRFDEVLKDARLSVGVDRIE